MKEVLYIEGRRDGYSPDQCGRTLTVGELIDFLEQFDEGMKVYIANHNYTYGSITEYIIEEGVIEDE